MAKKALCVGINDYPYDGSDLNGCINDANGWAAVLTEHFAFPKSSVDMITDKQATKKNVLAAIKKLLARAKKGDVLVYTNSSHGSYIADTDGDEETYDEIVCPYDISDNHLTDDEFRGLFSALPDGVHLTVILDNCFSGSGTRVAISDLVPGLATPDDRRVRFLSPALRGMKVLENPWTARPKTRVKHPQSKMKEVLLSGCTDKEYSYDANINGKYHGAMTYYALRAIENADYRLTYAQLETRLRNLIRDYPQHPQLEGTSANKKRYLFT